MENIGKNQTISGPITPNHGALLSRWMIVGMLALSLRLLAFAGSSDAATETVIHDFARHSGYSPYAGLTAGSDGTLYGTTLSAGREGGLGGSVFSLTPPTSPGGNWGKAVLYLFHTLGSGDGAAPYGGLLFGKNRTLYGTTTHGGPSDTCTDLSGCGTVFALAPPTHPGRAWRERILYSFTGGTDGRTPLSGLVMDQNGVLYGTAAGGGASGFGTVFALTPSATPSGRWSESVLYSFSGGSDGSTPVAGLLLDHSGTLYGTTTSGGLSGYGTVFALTPAATQGDPWTESVLYSFAGGSDGDYPEAGVVFGRNGVLYGTTLYGGRASLGTVFALAPPAATGGTWTETVIHSFARGSDGIFPSAGVLAKMSGTLYGTTQEGGTSGAGTVYQLNPPTTGNSWKEVILLPFDGGSGGFVPDGGLITGKGGALYGTTSGGGDANSTSGDGTVFEVTP